MNNFIEINDGGRKLLINLNRIAFIESRNPNCSDFLICFDDLEHGYVIDKEQYETIKAKLIDNKSKE